MKKAISYSQGFEMIGETILISFGCINITQKSVKGQKHANLLVFLGLFFQNRSFRFFRVESVF